MTHKKSGRIFPYRLVDVTIIPNCIMSAGDKWTIWVAVQYQDIIVNRAKYYLYKLRSDVPAANIANAEFEEGVKRIRLNLIEKSSYMRDGRVNLSRFAY